MMDSEMTNALEKTRTELAVERADYNVGLKEADFSRRELGARRRTSRRRVTSMSRLLADVIYRWRYPLTALFVLGALLSVAARQHHRDRQRHHRLVLARRSGLPGLRAVPRRSSAARAR